MREVVEWINVERASVIVAALALLGIFYSWRSAQAAKTSADAARSQADSAREQVDLGRQQIELLLKQVAQTEEAQRATRQAQEESLQPMVVVDIVPARNNPSVMVLTVENIGPSIARNVRIAASPPPTRSFDGPDRKPMHEWHIFTHGIKTMPPGQKMEFLFDMGSRRFTSGLPTELTFLVDAEGPFGSVPQMTFEIDLDVMRDVWVGQTTTRSIVDELARANIKLAELASAVRQLDPEEAGARRLNHQAALAELEAAE
jgi:hypothetical protein